MMPTRKFSWVLELLLVVATAVPGIAAATSKTKAKFCQKDVDRLCSNVDNKNIPNCLFSPENREKLTPQCLQALRVRQKKTMAACKPVAELVCKKEIQLGLMLGPCLRKRAGDPGFPDECKARLAQISQEPPLWNSPSIK